LHGVVHAEFAMWASDHRIVPRTGQFMDRNRNLYLNIAGASINEPAEVFNHRRVGIYLGLWVEAF
jgi:hypothetical protein